MKNFFKSAAAFCKAFVHVTIFELLIKLVMTAIGAPLLAVILKFTMKIAGLSYLTDDNLLVYLKNPLTLVAMLMILFFAAFFSFVELSALTGCYACYIRHEKMNVIGMFRTGLHSFKKCFHGSGIGSFSLFMLFMPMAQFTIASGIFLAPLMPILQKMLNRFGSGMAILSYILIQLLFVLLIASKAYSLHYLVLTDKPFRECIKQSKQTIKGHKLKMLAFLLLWSLFMLAAIAVLTFGISFIIVFVIKGFSKPNDAFRTSLKVLIYAGRVFTAISAFFSAPAIMCMLTGKFLADTNENIRLPDTSRDKHNKKITAVTAHRGFSTAAPENTLAAFQAALDSGADYIELDVQLTKDGELVVFHDDTIDRTTDGSGKLSSFTYDELQQFSAGSWFGKDGEFDDQRIPKLSEVLDLIGDDIMINIEIKRHGNVAATAEKVVELINEYGIRSSCYVTSFSYPALKTVKKLDPKIKTGLIANLATSTSYSQLKNIDAVSMNYIFVNQSVVDTAHLNGKKVFVWTVDRPLEIQQMVNLGVDNIITNRPDKASEAIDSRSVGDTILNVLEHIFR